MKKEKQWKQTSLRTSPPWDISPRFRKHPVRRFAAHLFDNPRSQSNDVLLELPGHWTSSHSLHGLRWHELTRHKPALSSHSQPATLPTIAQASEATTTIRTIKSHTTKTTKGALEARPFCCCAAEGGAWCCVWFDGSDGYDAWAIVPYCAAGCEWLDKAGLCLASSVHAVSAN